MVFERNRIDIFWLWKHMESILTISEVCFPKANRKIDRLATASNVEYVTEHTLRWKCPRIQFETALKRASKWHRLAGSNQFFSNKRKTYGVVTYQIDSSMWSRANIVSVNEEPFLRNQRRRLAILKWWPLYLLLLSFLMSHSLETLSDWIADSPTLSTGFARHVVFVGNNH